MPNDDDVERPTRKTDRSPRPTKAFGFEGPLKAFNVEMVRAANRLAEQQNASIRALLTRDTRVLIARTLGAIQAHQDAWELQLAKGLNTYAMALNSQAVEALRKFDASWKLQVAETLTALQRIQLPDFARTFKQLRELARQSRPSNWPEDVSLERLGALIEATGWPLVWAPRASIIRELADASDQEARERILRVRRREIIEDACSVAWHVRDPDLEPLIPAIGQAAGSLFDGYPMASQALSASILANLLSAYGIHRFRDAPRALPQDWENESIVVFRFALIGRSVVKALSRFFPQEGDPIPERFNRHATAHTVAAAQYTEINAIVALILVASFIREFEQLRRHGLA